MPYRLLVTNVPLRVGEEEFYDYVRAHVGGEAVVNALLIMRPDNTEASPHMSSSGAALVDYSMKSAADAARRVDFFVDGASVMMKAVGSVPAPGRHAEMLAEEGREAYQRLRCGVSHADRRAIRGDTAARQKRRRGDDNAVAPQAVDRSTEDTSIKGNRDDEEVELLLVGVPHDVYGSIFGEGLAGAGAQLTCQPTFDLFADVALSVRRATLGELLSLRRITDDEALIRVSADTAEALLERAANGLQLLIQPTTTTDEAKEPAKAPCDKYLLSVRQPRPCVHITGDSFELATKHEVVGAMARIMEVTNAKVAGFMDPFGNFLLPSVK
ncbi:hypothetical protein TraAM80_09004 [Trypanosoma rangeli]|uniref:Uncharacterized protein n=1 Tax=Trypanosoma rangeli TaxID=5698 RepID=A0A422MYC7_TRYRA|nr:uncharacterized protein TraAM80_09004 [Trypanosoma rangeli]RNE98223.1 hypothetical protein TraAM80_09004 [Trypanosoma rangeli]|eukprot:RNE98223.1 hypothetical protein TraAM80_09004 [Trypanosoma rangeli]